jgi:metallophosphoesterase (TIGR00282 family)
MKILCIGDIVGEPGRDAVRALLPGLKKEFSLDFVIANAENSAGGAGLTPKIAKELLQDGCDVLTLGDHVWDQKELEEYLKTSEQVIRPANFPEGAPGQGYTIRKTKTGAKIGVINMLGRVFMRHQVECPFRKLKTIVDQIHHETPNIILDMHTEATSEKVAIGHYIDGQVSAVFGTHTHIQTADEKILPRHTAYITDLGMTGPYDSVIGQDKENIINRFLTSLPIRFHVAREDVKLHGIVIDVDERTGQARSIERVQRASRKVSL